MVNGMAGEPSELPQLNIGPFFRSMVLNFDNFCSLEQEQTKLPSQITYSLRYFIGPGNRNPGTLFREFFLPSTLITLIFPFRGYFIRSHKSDPPRGVHYFVQVFCLGRVHYLGRGIYHVIPSKPTVLRSIILTSKCDGIDNKLVDRNFTTNNPQIQSSFKDLKSILKCQRLYLMERFLAKGVVGSFFE